MKIKWDDIIQAEEQEEKKNEGNWTEYRTIKYSNILVMGVPEKKEEKGAKNIYISINNGCKHPKFDEKYYLYIQESQRTPSRISKKTSTDTS